ncbi:hypothetical protein FQZ97_979190 [compost metagenome]
MPHYRGDPFRAQPVRTGLPLPGRCAQAPFALRAGQANRCHICRKIQRRRLDEGFLQGPQQIEVLEPARSFQAGKHFLFGGRADPLRQPQHIAQADPLQVGAQRACRRT